MLLDARHTDPTMLLSTAAWLVLASPAVLSAPVVLGGFGSGGRRTYPHEALGTSTPSEPQLPAVGLPSGGVLSYRTWSSMSESGNDRASDAESPDR